VGEPLGAQRWSSHRNQVFNDGMKEMDQEDIKSKDGFDKASKTVAIIGGLISAIVIISLSFKNARAWVMRTFRLDHNDGVDAQKPAKGYVSLGLRLADISDKKRARV
jgi:hypothetical protein